MPNLLFLFLLTLIIPLATAFGSDHGGALRVLFIGDSLTAGYGVLQEQAYPARVAELARQDGIELYVVNAGMSGDTSAGVVRRLPWLLKQRPDAVVVAIGANDGLRGLPTTELGRNLRHILEGIKEQNPTSVVVLAGMQVPHNLGRDYSAAFGAVYPAVAKAYNAALIPFLLEGVALNPDRNLADGIHPNEVGHEIIADTVWQVMRPLLTKPQQEQGPQKFGTQAPKAQGR